MCSWLSILELTYKEGLVGNDKFERFNGSDEMSLGSRRLLICECLKFKLKIKRHKFERFNGSDGMSLDMHGKGKIIEERAIVEIFMLG